MRAADRLSALGASVEREYRELLDEASSASALEDLGRAIGAALSRVDGVRRETHVEPSFLASSVHEEADAQRAGRAWAEREADALAGPPAGPWRGTTTDALPLVDHDDDDRRRDLAEIANNAARQRWEHLVERASDG